MHKLCINKHVQTAYKTCPTPKWACCLSVCYFMCCDSRVRNRKMGLNIITILKFSPSLWLISIKVELRSLCLLFSDCPSCQTGATATTGRRSWPTSRSPRTLLDHYEGDLTEMWHHQHSSWLLRSQQSTVNWCRWSYLDPHLWSCIIIDFFFLHFDAVQCDLTVRGSVAGHRTSADNRIWHLVCIFVQI